MKPTSSTLDNVTKVESVPLNPDYFRPGRNLTPELPRLDGMRVLLTALAGFAGAALVVGCGSGTAPAHQVSPPKYVAASCPAPAPATGPGAGPSVRLGPFGGSGGGIPDGFTPAWVLACPIELRVLPGQGSWQVQVTQRADLTAGQASRLLALLRQPSDVAGPDQICTAEGIVLEYYALVDAHGTAIEPAIPTDACGKPKPDVVKELSGLPYRELSVRPEAPAS